MNDPLLFVLLLFIRSCRSFPLLAQTQSLERWAEQVRGVEGVARAMGSIAQVAVNTEQAVLQTRKTVEDLVKLADELTRSLSRFKLAAA